MVINLEFKKNRIQGYNDILDLGWANNQRYFYHSVKWTFRVTTKGSRTTTKGSYSGINKGKPGFNPHSIHKGLQYTYLKLNYVPSLIAVINYQFLVTIIILRILHSFFGNLMVSWPWPYLLITIVKTAFVFHFS